MNYIVINTSMLATNTYIIFNDNTKEAMAIDVGGSAKEIQKLIEGKGYTLKYILLTHLHFDHCNGVKELKELTGAKVYIPKLEENFITSFRNLAAGVGKVFHKFTPDVLLEGGEKLNLLGYDIDVIHTPGHTVGSTTYLFDKENIMFVGDTLFKGSYGRVDLPTGNFTSMLQSIEKLCGYEKNYLLLTGHGDSTTLDNERINNGYSKNNN